MSRLVLLLSFVLLFVLACRGAAAPPLVYEKGRTFQVSHGEYRGAVLEVWEVRRVRDQNRYVLVATDRDCEPKLLMGLLTESDIATAILARDISSYKKLPELCPGGGVQ